MPKAQRVPQRKRRGAVKRRKLTNVDLASELEEAATTLKTVSIALSKLSRLIPPRLMR